MTMIFGPRPTLGWLGYLMIGGSWRRLSLVLVAVFLICLFIVDEGQKMITLRHITPAPFPPPVTFVHSPDNSFLTPLDACSVEAASAGTGKAQTKRRIYVYLWKETLTPADEWAKWILRLPMVQVTYMDLSKVVSGTDLSFLRRTTFVGSWQKWLAARLGILWSYGGICMTFGSIMTNPLSVEVMGPHDGILVEGNDKLLDPIILGTPSHHPLIFTLAKYLVNGTSGASVNTRTQPRPLLTKAVLNGCGINKLLYLPSSDCASFNFITNEKTFSVTEGQGEKAAHHLGGLLIRYPEEHYTFRDDNRILSYFRTSHLEKYCPLTARHLERKVASDGM